MRLAHTSQIHPNWAIGGDRLNTLCYAYQWMLRAVGVMLRAVSVAWPKFVPSRPARLGRTDEFDRWWEHHTSISDRSLVFKHQPIPCGDHQPSRRIARILW